MSSERKMDIPKSYSSPRWTGEIADCSLPVTFDTYSNCAFGCVYCFSQYQRGVGGGKEDYKRKKVECVNVDSIKKLFLGEKPNNQFWAYIRDRRPVQWGGLSDEFDWYEREYGVTLELLKFFKEINYPLSISTKGTWWLKDDRYRAVIKGQDNWHFKYSIITLDEEDAKRIERGVSSPQERIWAIGETKELTGGNVTLRLRPFMPGVSDKTYLDLIRAAHEAGADSCTTEFFCLEMRSINTARKHYQTISEVAGFDIVDFYRGLSVGTGYLRLNRGIKRQYIEKMQKLCHELGMRFYVSDADFKECSDNCCCCGLSDSWQHSRGQFTQALMLAKQTGSVRWSDIKADMYFLESVPYVGANGFNTTSSENKARFQGKTMKDYLHYLWNNPKRGQSPYNIFRGALVPDGKDENGDIVYKFNRKVTI